MFVNPAAPGKAWREELHPRDHGKFADKSASRIQPDLGSGPKVPPAPEQRGLFGHEVQPAAAAKIAATPPPAQTKERQETLFHGLKDAPGQQDLFEADRGTAAAAVVQKKEPWEKTRAEYLQDGYPILPANRLNGRDVYVGKPGQSHFQINDKMPAGWWNQQTETGWVNRQGTWLTKDEAAKVIADHLQTAEKDRSGVAGPLGLSGQKPARQTRTSALGGARRGQADTAGGAGRLPGTGDRLSNDQATPETGQARLRPQSGGATRGALRADRGRPPGGEVLHRCQRRRAQRQRPRRRPVHGKARGATGNCRGTGQKQARQQGPAAN